MQPTGSMTREQLEAYEAGRAAFERGESEEALERFTLFLQQCPRFADVHYMVGLIHERTGDLEAATRSLERALHINPGYAEAALALASVCERSGDFERPRTLAERVDARATPGALDPTTRGKLANLEAAVGDAYRQAGDLAGAIDAYRRALDSCPGFHDIRHRLGVALRDAGRPSQAAAEFRRVLRANTAYLDSAVQLGLTSWTLGRAEEALQLWADVLARDAERRDARMYQRLVRGALAERRQRGEG